jgi:uncharacterized protein
MTQPAKSQEPSMEEILASIRRIIADDDASKVTQRGSDAAKGAGSAAPVEASPPLPSPSLPSAPLAAPRSTETAAIAAPIVAVEQRAAEVQFPAGPAAAEPEAAAEEAVEHQASDVLGLTKSVAESIAEPMTEPTRAPNAAASEPSSPPEARPEFREFDVLSDVSFEQATKEPERNIDEPDIAGDGRGRAESHGGNEQSQLISPKTSAAVDSAFNALAQTVLVQNARTLEDLVREMLRPMLKTWLDDNLPSLVERLVRAEIERVSRGR